MTRHSSVEIDPLQLTESSVPLSDRPLVAENQNTVISQGQESSSTIPDTPLSATAREIRDRLFALPDAAEDAEQGVRIGQLEVEARIGSGGMGAVFRAVDLELSRKVALKVLHPTIAADPSLAARFRNEARACAQLSHDNIARVFFSSEENGVHFIAYEYADGLTLKQLIDQRGVLTSEVTVNYAIQATLALNHMNNAGIVHRDIKPSNIILTNNGRIKVVDLGLARRDSNDSIGDLTVAGTTLGTFDYIAPEQARDPRSADIRSDIYSLGCTVYHMLTGQPPYPEGTALQKLLDHQGKSPPDPRLISKDVSAELAAVVQKMMNTDPDQRYQDPGQLLADLMDLAAWMGLRSVPAEGIVWRRIPVTRVRELSGSLFVTGAVIAICLTALAMHFMPSGDPPDVDENDFFGLGQASPTQRVAAAPQSPNSGTPENDPSGDSASVPVKGSLTPANLPTEAVGPVATSGTPGTIPDVPTPPIAVPTPPAPFIVYHLDGPEKAAKTLQEAWADAKNGDVIELNFNGPREALTYRLGPLVSQEAQQITIRAARGYSPVIVFEGDDRPIRSTAPGQLFYLSSNLKLVLSGIHFRVRVKEDVQADQWVLFECNGTNRIDMRDCTISIENRVSRDTAVFRLNDQTSKAYAGTTTAIELKNVVVRGICDLVLVVDQAGGSVSAENCGFAIDGSLVDSLGSSAMVPQGDLVLNLNHTTSILGRPAIRMQDSQFLDGREPERTLPKLEVNSHASVYSAAVNDGVLVEVRGNAYREDLQDHLIWSGSNNLYHQYTTFWLIESGSLDGDVRPFNFNEWQTTWNRMTVAREVAADMMADEVWKNHDPLPGRADLGRLRTESFALDRRFFYSPDNMPVRHNPDSNGQMAGVDVSRLPDVPEAEAVKEPVTDVADESVVQPTELLPAPAETTEPPRN